MFSGWTDPDNPQDVQNCLWATPQTVWDAAALLAEDKDTLSEVIAKAGTPNPTSTVGGQRIDVRRMPEGLPNELALSHAAKVSFIRDVVIVPYTTIKALEQGVVAASGRNSGAVDVFMETYHVGLMEFGNCVWLIPHETEEWLAAVEQVSPL